ncbi:hypothetical protein Sjap_017821 [Stephania japonica]|uniref:ZCF37 n=1 Tax=Stephania japonica TaxID=461633 RepID=A0AAP0I6V5_9MAGN
MLKPFVCGSGSFGHEHDEEYLSYNNNSSSSTPRRSKSCRSSSGSKNKNPYSARGLDKFAMVLADLDERRQKIYEQMGLQDDSLVRFGYSSSKGWVPIVVKLKGQDGGDQKAKLGEGIINRNELLVQNLSSEVKSKNEQVSSVVKGVGEEQIQKKRSLMGRVKLSDFMRPYYYLAFVLVLILLCLMIYGRSFAILCTSISWYWVPTIKGNKDLNLRRSMKKKKVLIRKFSENKMKSDGLCLLSPKSKKQNGYKSG